MAQSWNVQDEGESTTDIRAPRPSTFKTVFDVKFMKSVPGILMIVQIICCFLGFVIAVSWRGAVSPGHGFFVFISFSAFVSCLAIFMIRLIKLDDLMNRDFNWIIVFTVYSGIAGLFMLISSCVMLEVARAQSSLKAASVFGLFAWTALLANFLINGHLLWQKKKGWLPQLSATVSSNANTASESSRPNRNGRHGSLPDEIPDDFSEDEDAGDDGAASVALTSHTALGPSSNIDRPQETW